MNKLTNNQIQEYNLKRQEFDKSRIINTISPCIAAHNNMYFTTEGRVAPCWLLVGHVDQYSSNRSMKDIWFGDRFSTIRKNLEKGIFEDQCRICKQKIEADTWPLALAYDGFTIKEYPTLLELELSNQCNLECVMCEGRLSSGIRKNRDKLPPLPMIYNDSFIDEIREFIPHLEELRFNGGEPFAQKIVLEICMLVAEIKPDLKINIATNGTVYNKQVKAILENCNLHLNVSIDSLTKEIYENIRLNGNFDVLMENFLIFKDYCHSNNRGLSVMVNPMRDNWWEMPKFVEFTNEHKVYLWFNTIHHPENLSLWSWSSSKLKEVIDTLRPEVENLEPKNYDNHVAYGNWKKLDHFVNNQVVNWYEKQVIREEGKKIFEIKSL